LRARACSTAAQAQPLRQKTRQEIENVTIRFCGDSGDGTQPTGTEFTLAYAIAGHPKYEVSAGSVRYRDQNVLELPPDERARLDCRSIASFSDFTEASALNVATL